MHSRRWVRKGLERNIGNLIYHPIAVFFASVLVVGVLERDALSMPPVWDGAMGLFPAAHTLADTGFDLSYLMEQPGFTSGGPNVHALSPVTWITAMAIWLIPGDVVYPTLHVFHFLLAAAAATQIYMICRQVLSKRVALMLWVVVLVFPLFLVQAGSMYLEIPLLLATLLAFSSWQQGRLRAASGWAVLATLMKPVGLVIAISIVAVELTKGGRRIRRAVLVVAPSLVAAAVQVAVLAGISEPDGLPFDVFVSSRVWAYVRHVPDVITISVVYLLTFVFRRRSGALDDVEDLQLLVFALLTGAIAFYISAPVFGHTGPVLPRYFVQLVPFVLIGTTIAIRSRLSERTTLVVLVCLAIAFSFNFSGRLYPPTTTNEFSIVERSHEYRDLLELQLKETALLGSLPEDVPVFYSLPEHYRLEYPELGYPGGPIVLGHNVLVEEPYRFGSLGDYPREFYMLFTFAGLGGEIILSVWDQAVESGRRVGVETLRSGVFVSTLVHIYSTN